MYVHPQQQYNVYHQNPYTHLGCVCKGNVEHLSEKHGEKTLHQSVTFRSAAKHNFLQLHNHSPTSLVKKVLYTPGV